MASAQEAITNMGKQGSDTMRANTEFTQTKIRFAWDCLMIGICLSAGSLVYLASVPAQETSGPSSTLKEAFKRDFRGSGGQTAVQDQYAQYVIVDDIKINSKLTLGEDVADLGGEILATLPGKTRQKTASSCLWKV